MSALHHDDLSQFEKRLLKSIKELLTQKNLPRRWVKTYELQRLLNISSATLHSLCRRGHLRPTKVGRLLYFDLDEVNAWLEKNKTPPSAEEAV